MLSSSLRHRDMFYVLNRGHIGLRNLDLHLICDSRLWISPIVRRDAYQVQVQVPQSDVTSIQDVEHIPVTQGAAEHPLMGDVAQVGYGTVIGEYHRLNGQRMVTLTANISGEDLGRVSSDLDAATS